MKESIPKVIEYAWEYKYYGAKFLVWDFKSKTKAVCLLLILVLIPFSINAQNLISNPSFEEYKQCPDDLNTRYKKEIVPGWYMPSFGTADYFNFCTKKQVGVPQNFMGYCLPKDGLAYVGIILLHNPPDTFTTKYLSNYREYIQTSFTHQLERDKTYEISFYYFVASYSSYAVNRLGAYFSADKISNKRKTTVLNFKPQVFLDTVSVDYEPDKWFLFSGEYKARGGEKYLTIGNFYDDNKTAFKPCDLTTLSEVKQQKVRSEKIAYYYIDMVSVTEK